jgi:hypothetical protein
MSPLMACSRRSYPGSAAPGSVEPKALIEQKTTPRLRARTASKPRPRRSIVPGPEGLDHDVGARGELGREAQVGGILEVEDRASACCG